MGQSDPARSDAELVAAARGGAKEALAELVRRHWDTAVFLATRVLGSAELARDAAQEAAVAALTDLGRLRSPDRFGAWFCGIALNVSRRWLRQFRPEVPGDPADRASASPGPAEAAESADLAARVRAAVAALPDGQQDAVLLFYLQGLSHREVAGELGISVGAVKSRLHQARAALAPALAPVAGPPGKPKERSATVTSTTAESTTDWVEVTVAELRREQNKDPARHEHIVILAERGGDRQLPIWIGPTEATALALELEAVETPRPYTYKLAAGLVGAAGARIAEVRITRLLDQIYYACVLVDGPAGRQELDARPSDAVAVALVADAPIRVDDALFSSALPPGCAEELASCPVATAEIAAEARQRLHRPVEP